MNSRRWTLLAVVGLLASLSPAPVIAMQQGPDGPAVESARTVIYLVRHAEKSTENPSDPALTPEGAERATELARVLSHAGITHVFSTETTRTRTTAAPTAMQAGVSIAPYDPQGAEGMASFARQLLTTPGTALVVGHSNTTPELVEELGGDAVVPMTDDDYDRLYILTVGPDGTVSSALLHFGAASGGD